MFEVYVCGMLTRDGKLRKNGEIEQIAAINQRVEEELKCNIYDGGSSK
jgi:hypothetical protein